jgi:predicted type IV restriction endonuclease
MQKRKKKSHSLRDKIRAARSMIQDIVDIDANEAETRRRLERIFVDVLGYDEWKDLTREKSVRGAGDTEHVDFAVKIEREFKFFVELKRVSAVLAPKHLKQAVRYAIDSGINWVVLTNSVQWEVYHIEYGKPPKHAMVLNFDFLKDDIGLLVKKMPLLSKKIVKRGGLDNLWSKTKSLSVGNLLKAILADDSIRAIRRNIRKETEVSVSVEEIVSALRKTLNEKALSLLENLSVVLSPSKRVRTKRKKAPSKSKEAVKSEDTIKEPEKKKNLNKSK